MTDAAACSGCVGAPHTNFVTSIAAIVALMSIHQRSERSIAVQLRLAARDAAGPHAVQRALSLAVIAPLVLLPAALLLAAGSR